MKFVGRPGRLGQVLVALAVLGVGFGITSAVQADIPDSGVIHGCYGKPGTPQKGQLRVRDFDQGEQCRFYENTLDWNAVGPTGATGPTGPTGPSDTYYASGEVTSNGGTPVVIASLTLPAGNYLVAATGWAAGLTAGLKDLRCFIGPGFHGDADDTFLSVGLDTVDIGGQESWANHHDVALPGGGTVDAECLDSGAVGTVLEGAQLTATAVATLHGPTFLKPLPGKGSPTPTH